MAHPLSTTVFKVIDILNDCKVHAGTEIAERLDISRTAVWKIVKQLKKYSIDIESEHLGYQLKSPLLLLDKKKIESLLQDPSVTLEMFETLSSTSDYLRDKTSPKNKEVCLSEHMSKGRGRLGRSWISPFGRNIYCSLNLLFNKDICELSGLSLVVGILVANALESLDPDIKPFLKWPNDIYVNGQKMGGILIDLLAEAYGNARVIIGIGLNVNMKDVELQVVSQPWTSLEHVLNKKMDRNVIVAHLIQHILKGLEIFIQKGMDPFLAEWDRYDLLKSKEVSLGNPGPIVSGIAKGINKHGYLLLELPTGEIKPCSFGDTTLLKN
jgi:BirA family biotin operon repressor/biotin-[acetyl-CoA-carboxylase] ligase